MHEVINSSVFRMAKSKFLKEMILLYGTPWIISFIILILICVVMSVCHDIRWIIIGLMAVFIICPMMIAFFYIFHGMKEVTVTNTIPHKLEFTKDKFSIVLYSENKESEDAENKKEQEDTENKYSELSSRSYPYSTLSSFKTGISSVILLMKAKKGFVWIPTDVFPKEYSFNALMEIICQGMRKGES